MTVLVCAATRPELAACGRGIEACGVAPETFATMLTGVGVAHATRSLADRLARVGEAPRPSLIISSGFAGALTTDLAVGTWVTASRLLSLEGGARIAITCALRPAPAVTMAMACTVVSSSELSLAQPSGDAAWEAVDMESAALARVAATYDVPFMVLRLVSDTPDRPLPSFLSPFTSAMAATEKRAKLASAVRGLRGALGDLRGVARLMREGGTWTRELEDGWSRFASQLL